MKEFTTAVEATTADPSTGEVQPLTTKIDGEQVWFTTASVGQVSMAIAAGYAGSQSESIATLINLFFGLITNPPTPHDGRSVQGRPAQAVKAHFRHRLFDQTDDFGPTVIAQVIHWLVEEWSADPTQPSSDSTPTRDSTGELSTTSP